MGEIRSYFSRLSYEMVVDIFDYLTHTDRKNCRLICHRWRILLDNCGKYFSFRAILSNVTQKQFFNSYRTMKCCTMKNHTNDIPENGHYPKIYHAILGWRNSEENIIDFLKSGCGDVKSLTITKFSLGQCIGDRITKSLQDLSWQNLSQLKLNVIFAKYKISRVVNHVDATILLLKLIRIPNIRELDFELLHKYDCYRCSKALRANRFQNLLVGLYEFMANHAKSLKSLNCTILKTRRPRAWFPIPEIPEKIKQSFVADLNLRQISLKFWGVKRVDAMITPELCGSQLKSLTLDSDIPDKKRYPARGWWYSHRIGINTDWNVLEMNFSRIFANNGKSLQNVTFMIFPLVNFSWFQNCFVLTSVEIQAESPPPTNPRDIFENCALSLRTVRLCSLSFIDLSWLKNCVKLEKLVLEAQHGTGQRFEGLEKLPPIRLKKFELHYVWTADQGFGVGLQEFINRCGETLEELVIWTPDFPLSLRECRVLKQLKLFGLNKPIEFIPPFPAHSFIYLKRFRGSLYFNGLSEACINSTIALMPNLESIGNFTSYWPFEISPSAIQLIFRIPKLVEMVIDYPSYSYELNARLIEATKICETTEGLRCEKGYDDSDLFWNKKGVLRIFADRSVYRNPE